MFRTYRICNPTLEFSKYNFINKLLGNVTLFRVTSGVVTPGVTLSNFIPPNIFDLDANFDKSTVKLHYIHIFFILTKFNDQKSIVMSYCHQY